MFVSGIDQTLGRVNNESLLVDVMGRGISTTERNREDGFGIIFDGITNLWNETSVAETNLSELQLQFVTGQTDDILAVMLAEQKVQTLVTFTAQVTSSIMDAYRTIINMPV